MIQQQYIQLQTQEPLRILFLGDSITFQGMYIDDLHTYFTTHFPNHSITFIKQGLSSETASGLSEPDHPFERPCIHV